MVPLRGRPRKYDWDSLFHRRSFTLVRHTDYAGSAADMAQQVRNAASSRRVSVSLEESDGVIRVKVNRKIRRATAKAANGR